MKLRGIEMPQRILETLEEQVKPEHTALIIVDPQNDFCASDGVAARLMGWDVSRIQSAVQRLNPFIQKARETGLMIVWTKSLVAADRARPSYRARSLIRRATTRNIAVVKEGSDGADWYSEVTKPIPDEYVVTKWHYDAFADTNLDLLLSSKGIKTLLVTGFSTNVCVETTARHGYIKGYYIVLVSDCTDAPTQQEYEPTVHNIRTYFGKVATSVEILKIWEAITKPAH